MDVSRHPVALLRGGQPLRLRRGLAQLLVRRRQLAARPLLTAQQLGDDRREQQRREGAEPLAQPRPPPHRCVHERDESDHQGRARQWEQQHALAHQDHEEERGRDARDHREDRDGQHQLDHDVRHRPSEPAAPSHPAEADRAQQGEDRTEQQRRDGMTGADDTDDEREEGATGQHREGPVHAATVGRRRSGVNADACVPSADRRGLRATGGMRSFNPQG